MNRALSCLAAMLLTACNGNGDLTPPSGVAANCGSSEPVITEVELEESDPFTLGNGSVVPGLLVNAKLTDADGDLHWYEMKVWFDDVIDGEIDTTQPYYEAYGTRGDLDCGVSLTEVPLRVAVNGNPPANTEVEVGVIVYDDMGNATNGGEPTIIAFVTPGGE